MAIFHLGAVFDACEGNGLTFTATFPWLECLIVLWVFFLFYPLPHHRHLSSFARPPPTPLSSCVIFWLTPPYPLIGWRNLWTAPYHFHYNIEIKMLTLIIYFKTSLLFQAPAKMINFLPRNFHHRIMINKRSDLIIITLQKTKNFAKIPPAILH